VSATTSGATAAFDAVLEYDQASGGAFVVVPVDVRAIFGRARPPVRVTIGSHTYRSTVSVYGGVSMVGVNRANREAAGVDAGQMVHVTLEADDDPRTVDVPPDLTAALDAAPEARAAFDAMPYTHRLEYSRWLEEAKRPETRARRLTAAIDRIRAGRTAG
jgi:hypothetical protein